MNEVVGEARATGERNRKTLQGKNLTYKEKKCGVHGGPGG